VDMGHILHSDVGCSCIKHEEFNEFLGSTLLQCCSYDGQGDSNKEITSINKFPNIVIWNCEEFGLIISKAQNTVKVV
jgi:hypothetical protein